MKINEEITNGNRLKDMPDEWFIIPENDELKNSMISVLVVFACNRLMDEHRFDEADAQKTGQKLLIRCIQKSRRGS